jgi:hypothetical protein
MAKYLPLGVLGHPSYGPYRTYGDISGGKVWEAARQFHGAGVPAELVQRLQQWGIKFTDRAARLQYERYGLGAERHESSRKTKGT